MGNGNYESGDGWRYRGRWLKQLTGRENYRDFTIWSKEFKSEWPDEVVDFEGNPDLLTQPKYAARSAAYFWVTHGLSRIADQGATAKEVRAITAIVNFYTSSYGARFANFKMINDRGDLV